MFDPFERVARAHHMCPCCERSFSAEEEDDFVNKVGAFDILFSISSIKVLFINIPRSNWNILYIIRLKLIGIYCVHLQQRVKATNSAERIKLLAVECSNVDSCFQQLEKLRIVYEEYTKIWKDTIPLTEKNLNELSAEMDIKSQSLDDVTLQSNLTLFMFFFVQFIWYSSDYISKYDSCWCALHLLFLVDYSSPPRCIKWLIFTCPLCLSSPS